MYSIRRPGKLAFGDAGPKSRNTRLSRTVIIYAQYQMAPLAMSLFVPPSHPSKTVVQVVQGWGSIRKPSVGTQTQRDDEEQQKSNRDAFSDRQGKRSSNIVV